MWSVNWTQAIDSYCERTDASYWSEPLNAISNLSFLIAALATWRMAHAAADRPAQALALGAATIGIGSYLFHTHATVWALQADVLPIRAFILAFIALSVGRFFNLPWWLGVGAAAGFLVFSAAAVKVIGHLVGPLHGSAGYAPVPMLMAVMGVILLRRSPATGRGLLLCAAVFTASLVLRTVDLEICTAWPMGTHFAWHLLNGFVVGFMLVIFIRARTPEPASR